MQKNIFIALLLFGLFAPAAFAVEGEGKVEEIILVFKTHFDIGYTKLASEVIENYRTGMIDNALAVVDASDGQPDSRKFIWTIPGWPLVKILENQPPERAAKLERAVGEGRFAVHALPFTTHTETLVEEDLIHGLRYADMVCREFGLDPPTAAKMTDVPCHSWFLSTLLSHAGVTFMHEGTNTGCADPEVPILYFREGPDGSRVLTMHVNGYGTGITPPDDWPYKTWLGLIHTGDNHGPPRPEEIDALFRRAAEKYPGVKVRIGKLDDFGDAIIAREDLAAIPVVRGDMPDTWIHGSMCDPQGQALARAVHERISHAEMLGTLIAIRSGKIHDPNNAKRIASAREQSLLYGEHTWGSALYWVSNYGPGQSLPFGEAWETLWRSGNFSEQQKRAMASWEEHSDYIRNAAAMLPENTDAGSIFNPLPWDMVDYTGATLPAGGAGQSRPTEQSTVTIPASDGDVVIESRWFRLTVDGETGSVKSLRDLKHQREVFAPDQSDALPGFLYQRASAEMCDRFLDDYAISRPDWVVAEIGKQGVPRDVPELRLAPGKAKAFQLTASTTGRTLTIQYENDAKLPFDSLALDVTLFEHRPEVRFQFAGRGKRPDTWPEAGYFRFPLNIDAPQFRLGRLGGIVDPAMQIVRGSNRHLCWLRSGMAVFGEDGYGVGICPLTSPLVSLSEPGCWRYSKDFTPDKADVFFNLFNNQWTTNFRLWNEGDISTAFVLWTFDGYDAESSLITPSLESLTLNHSTILPDGVLDEGIRSISLNCKGIYVTAFGDDVDSGCLMLRMWEMAGQATDAVEIRLPDKLNARIAVPCDLRNRPVAEAIPILDGKLTVDVKPYAPINLRLE